MIKRIALTASFAVVAAAANAQVPFLSFADNSSITSTRVATSSTTSTYKSSGSGYTQGTGGTGITAPAPVDLLLTNLSFSLTPTLVGSGGSGLDIQEFNLTNGGTVTVSDVTLGKLFDVSFDFAELDASGFGASDANGDNVVYKNVNAILLPYIKNTATGDAFGFSFANATVTGNTITYSTQAQFSSTPVPEPTTMAALGLGAVAMLRRRRKA